MSYFPEVPSSEWKNLLTTNANDFAKLKVYKPLDGEEKPQKVKFVDLCVGGKSLNLEMVTKALLEEGSTALNMQ
jgi:hypothetical protein